MANELVIIDNSTETAQKAAAAALGLSRSNATAKLLEKKDKANEAGNTLQKRKNKAKKVQDGKIAALRVFKYCPFIYADGRIALIPMTALTAKAIGVTLVDRSFIKTAGTRILGAKKIGNMKSRKFRVSYGMAFVDRKVATRGKKTGRTGSSRSVSKGLVRRWTTISAPLNANSLDILYWISAVWKRTPQLCEIGQQILPLRTSEKAATIAGPNGEKLLT